MCRVTSGSDSVANGATGATAVAGRIAALDSELGVGGRLALSNDALVG